jgi:NADH-quinone oxidoreductase subunit K
MCILKNNIILSFSLQTVIVSFLSSLILFGSVTYYAFCSFKAELNSVNLLLVSFSAYSGNSDGQVFVFFIMVVAAAEVAVGLALLMSIYRNVASTDINVLNKLKW